MMQRLTRRRLLGNSAALGLGAWAGGLRAQAACPAVVQTRAGKLRGECLQGGVRVFRGVPFAAPPVGALRFRAPAAVAAWVGERDATRFAASPLQSGETGVEHSEDCLYLNAWVPAGKGPFPVFVWIHGGGFTGGHAFEPMYDGAGMAAAGIVCVTVGYRLGVLGFLDVEPLLGPGYAGSGNNGLRDLMTALSWVRENIGDFGGDAGRVTVGGESAGAKLTDILMGVPGAKPLFQQMISESGGAERVWPRATAQGIGEGFGKAWTAATGLEGKSIATAAGGELIRVQSRFITGWPQHFPLRPELDGDLMKRMPVEEIAAGAAQGRRLLIGTNRDESAFFVGSHPQEVTAGDLGNLPLEKFASVLARYAEVYPEMTAEQRRIRAVTAEEYWVPTLRVAKAHARTGSAAFMYRLDFAETRGRLSGFAYHSLDVGMVWDRPHTGVGDDAAEAGLARQMNAAWTAFLKGGVPAAAGLPVWSGYEVPRRATMILDTVSRVQERSNEAELRLWDGVM